MADKQLEFPALSIRQPWANYVVLGIKDIENRSKPTNFRGTILIQASQTIDYDAGLTDEEREALLDAGLLEKDAESYDPITGAIIGMVDIVDCVVHHPSLYFEGPFGWVLANPILFKNPVEFKGKVGIFYVPRDLLVDTPAAATKAGEVDPKAFERKMKELESLANKGDVDTQYELALNLEMRGQLKESIIWYQRAAEGGNASSQNNLGLTYSEGTGTTRDPAQAALWFRRAAEQGLAVAQRNLAILLSTGDGIEKNLSEAIRLLTLAAESGYADAQNDLGEAFLEGCAGKRDVTQAAKWFLEAAQHGNEFADANFAILLNELTELADSGDKPAKQFLGRAYLEGIGVDQNVKLAEKLLGND
jgi:tetratricopeptide (TPR) repeat protein